MIGVTPLLDFMLVDLFDRPVSKLIHTPAALLRDKYLMRPLVLLDRSHYSQVPPTATGTRNVLSTMRNI